MLAQLVSLFLSLSPDCAIVFPGQFTGAGSSNVSVCLTLPPYCGVTYGFESSAAVRVNSRLAFADQDITQAPAIPFTAATVGDLGFTTINLVPFPAATRKEIARYNLTYSQSTAFKLRPTNAMVSVAVANSCVETENATVYVDVPIDGKLPAPVAIGVKR